MMTFAIYTLGCKVNTYESNVMSELLKNKGYKEVAFNKQADIYIINTCTVTNMADHKSMKMIRQAIKRNKNAIIVVVGCLVQNKDIKIDDVDIIIGNKNKNKIAQYIEEYIKNKQKIEDVKDLKKTSFENMQVSSFNKTRAFIKIQDGCNNYCAYCIIPYVRGNICSKDPILVIEEVNELVKKGHQEIVLTGIHTGSYGADLDNYDLSDLLKELVKIDGLKRIRISSIEITEINERLMNLIKDNPILVNHMHIPLQSGSNKILKLMNRKYDIDYFITKINKLRSIRPDISITTDVILGFPNETEEDFQETIETVRKIKFSKIHVFPYSKREGTVAAKMDNQVSNEIKKKRVAELIKVSKELEIDYMKKFINKEVTFIPEIYKNDYLIGHTGNYLLVKMKGDKNLINQEIKCEIVKVEYPYVIVNKK
ncbi:MAG: tRNA (N(6)-L-threonylcarbamoyladenosine(37)-C(2))-methylthiotransferase MtaB [Mollicutes bacterium]|nr:tRNA (N(6)-L-threonylcarbamoyladenosine(37)-C(2))-methylthiotransferase MtaB [Mollicutes bacterium]